MILPLQEICILRCHIGDITVDSVLVAYRLAAAAHTALQLLGKGVFQHHHLLGLTVGGATSTLEMTYPFPSTSFQKAG